MFKALLEKRRKKIRRYRRLQKGRILVFFLVFALLLFVNPQFIDKGALGSLEEEVSFVDEIEEPFEEEVEETGVIEEIEETGKFVYLTFDDGPTFYLADILDILAEYGVQATFFMLEPQMGDYVVELCRLREEGHGLGLHGVTHDQRKFYASQESVLGEMDLAQATLAELVGVESWLIRTPYGSRPYLKPAYQKALENKGYQLWDWNVDSRDWFYRDARMVTDTLQQIEAVTQRGKPPVVLLHERSETVRYLPQIIEYLLKHDYVLKVPGVDTIPVQFN